MFVIEKGHIYELTTRRPDGSLPPLGMGEGEQVTFVNRQPGQEHDGTTTQEVIRMLIDRTRHCNNCMPHRNNEQVIYHLRMALGLHEARAIERKIEKGLPIEYVKTGSDGHLLIHEHSAGKLDTTVLEPFRHDWDRPCNHPAAPAEPKAAAKKSKSARRRKS